MTLRVWLKNDVWPTPDMTGYLLVLSTDRREGVASAKCLGESQNHDRIGSSSPNWAARLFSMTDEEFDAWLQDEIDNNRMSAAQKDDLLAQKEIFEKNRPSIEETFRNRIVAYASGTRLVDDDLHRLIANAQISFPGAMVYFEPIAFDLY